MDREQKVERDTCSAGACNPPPAFDLRGYTGDERIQPHGYSPDRPGLILMPAPAFVDSCTVIGNAIDAAFLIRKTLEHDDA